MFAGSVTAEIAKDTPYDTKNLKKNATRFESLGRGQARIYIDTKIAPYFKYVNYYQYLNGGKANPNYLYFEKALKAALIKIARMNGGNVIV
jgi:hypothetical protein